MALSKIVENSIADEAVSSAKLKDFSAAVDLNGVELVLDADADTSITADTDDRIDIKIANTDHISFGTSSGDTVIKAMVDAKDILFQQFDGRTLLDINDGGFVGIANGATGPGELRIFEDTDNGTNYVGLSAGSISSSFTLTLPTADGSSGQFLKTDGSGALSFDTVSSAADDITAGDAAINLTTTSGNITIDAQGGDTDIIFKGTDGSSDITPMTLDMSDAGALLLTGGKIDLKNSGSRSKILFYCESGNAHFQTLQAAPHSESASNTLTLPSTGGDVDLVSTASTATLTNKTLTTPIIAEIDNSSNITLDAGADIILDADGADIIFKDGGTSILTITNNSTDVDFTVATQDKDINFKGDDGGSGITALSLDMSDAGTAVFNHDIRIADDGQIGSASDADAIAIAANGVTTFSQPPVLSGASISSGTIPASALGADSVTAAKIADDAISEEHLDVTAITGHSAITSLADTDKFLVSDASDSGNLKYVEKQYLPSGIYNLIASTNLSSEGTSFAMDNVFSDTYDKYLVFGERFRTGTNQSRIDLVLRTGGSSGSDAGNNLGGAYLGYRHSSNYVSGSVANGGAATIINNAYNDTHFHFMFNVFYPTTTGVTTAFQGQSTFREGSTSYSAFVNFGYVSLSTEDHTGFRIISSNGNFNSTDCRLTVYGITDGA